MPRNQGFWTDERVQILRSMWPDGRNTCEVIAVAVGAVSAAAVEGKAHRLKLPRRAQSYCGSGSGRD